MKRLYRSRDNKIMGGVCGGIGEYFNIDPTIVRVVWVIVFILPPHFFLELLVYIVLWSVIPKEPKVKHVDSSVNNGK